MNKLNRAELQQAKDIASEKVEAIKADLERKLNKWFNSAVHMEHGQIKSAARFTVNRIGYKFILSGYSDDEYVRMHIKIKVKTLVKTIVGQWHDNPARVWLQFNNYCVEMAAAAAAKDLIKNLTLHK